MCTPNTNFFGTDVITVQVCDSAPGTIVNQTLTIDPVNDTQLLMMIQ
jgi:hypothetical protein